MHTGPYQYVCIRRAFFLTEGNSPYGKACACAFLNGHDVFPDRAGS